jgi:hypothetical protein
MRVTAWIGCVVAVVATRAAAVQGLELGFSGGLRPLDLPGAPPAEDCGGCHPAELADWQRSMHKAAWTAPVFQAGYVVEPLEACVNCHAPLPEQVAEINTNAAWYRWQRPDTRAGPEPEKRPEPHAGEGITCAVCHVRDGAVLAVHADDAAPHPIAVEPRLGGSELCANCHEFNAVAVRDGVARVVDEVMQSTYSEWVASGEGSCQSCHMPEGRHLFRGANDRELLRSSLTVTAERRGARVVLTLASRGVGHDLPTGDLFRHLTVEVDRGAGFEVVARIGRTFALAHSPDGALVRETSDNRLKPGERREVAVRAPGAVRWRVVWHDSSEADEARAILPIEQITFLMAEGEEAARG